MLPDPLVSILELVLLVFKVTLELVTSMEGLALEVDSEVRPNMPETLTTLLKGSILLVSNRLSKPMLKF